MTMAAHRRRAGRARAESLARTGSEHQARRRGRSTSGTTSRPARAADPHPDPARVAARPEQLTAPKPTSASAADQRERACGRATAPELEQPRPRARSTLRGRARSGRARAARALRPLLQPQRHREQPAHARVEAVDRRAEPAIAREPDRSHRSRRVTGSSRSQTRRRRPPGGSGAAARPRSSARRSPGRALSPPSGSASSLTTQPSSPRGRTASSQRRVERVGR